MNLTMPVVTARAYARSAPAAIAGYPGRLSARRPYRSMSDLINEAVRLSLVEDAEDLLAFEE